MRIPLFNRTPKTPPRPEISAPVPGSGRPIAGPATPPQPSIPKNEYPHNRPIPNNVIMRDETGKLHLHHLPKGSRISSPMMDRPKEPSDQFDIHSLGWPANNRDTEKLRSLKLDHTQAFNDLEAARLKLPRLTSEEKKTLSPDRLKDRKQEISERNKEGKKLIIALEKSERQARRNLDVFKSRFSRELNIEADFRMNQRPETKRFQPGPEDNGIPTPTHKDPPPFTKSSKAPELAAIPEHERSPLAGLHFPNGTRPWEGYMEEAPSNLGPHEQQLHKLMDAYRETKNTYHGMKGESTVHGPAKVATAKKEFETAEAALKKYRKDNKANLGLERAGYIMPSLDELRQSLHPGHNADRYPDFEATQLRDPSIGPSNHDQSLTRPTAPDPDHPRNRNAADNYFGD